MIVNNDCPIFEFSKPQIQEYSANGQDKMNVKCIPCKPLFYIAKLGYAGVYLIFLFLIQNIHCGYTLEPPLQGGSNVYPQCMFRAKTLKISKLFKEISIFASEKNSLYIAWASFCNDF